MDTNFWSFDFELTKFNELIQMNEDTFCDVIGIIVEIKEIKELSRCSFDGKISFVKKFLIVDETCHGITIAFPLHHLDVNI